MRRPTRLVRHRDGVPVFQYRADYDTPPVAVVRAEASDVLEIGVHIHDFPALSQVIYVFRKQYIHVCHLISPR